MLPWREGLFEDMGVMGRVVAADDSLQDKLTALAKAGTFQVGLLIGQVSQHTHTHTHIHTHIHTHTHTHSNN